MDYKVSIEALGTSNALKEQGVFAIARAIVDHQTKNAAKKIAAEIAAMPTEEEEEEEEEEEPSQQCMPEVSEPKIWPTEAQLELQESQYIDIVELLPPVPKKGEFDVNKIMTSLYFFS